MEERHERSDYCPQLKQRVAVRTPVEEEGGHGGAPLAVLLEPVRLQDTARLRRGAVRRLALICKTAKCTA